MTSGRTLGRTCAIVGTVALCVTACGSGGTPAAGGTPSATAAPTPLPQTALTVQAAYTVTDTDQFDLAGSTAPGAAVVVRPPTTTELTTTADAQGHFSVHLSGLQEGLSTYTVAATASGFSTATADIAITRTVSPGVYKASAARIPYNQLIKDPAALAGRVVTYSAQVFQYDTSTTTSNMIAAVTDDGYGYWSDNVWLDVDPSMTGNVCGKTIIKFWGTVKGPYTYTTTNNGSLTIPEITVKYIQAIGAPC
jgi:hypothetical protein